MQAVLYAVFAAVIVAGSGSQSAAGVAGKWDLSIDTPHGVLSVGLDLQQNGATTTGKMIGLMNRDHDVKGEFKNGQLTLTTADEQMSVAATLKPDGSLAGHLSSPQGDVTLKGVRAKKS
jgi:hypothetical protein